MPSTGDVLVRVAAAGVGPWDALIRDGKSEVTPPPPLTLGSDLSDVVEETGPGVSQFIKGDEVYDVINPGFVGAQAEYTVASATMIARKPLRLSHLEAASAPAVAVTAWQNAPRLRARSSAANSPDFRSRRKCGCVCGSACGECRASMSLRSWVQKILNMCGGLEPKRLSTTTAETLNLPGVQWIVAIDTVGGNRGSFPSCT
jgi:Alcohol dehydrogenase GroES-like domain